MITGAIEFLSVQFYPQRKLDSIAQRRKVGWEKKENFDPDRSSRSIPLEGDDNTVGRVFSP